MVKRIGRRFVSLLLTFVTILTMLPAMTLPALAAAKGDLSIADKNIGLTYNGTEDGPKNGEPWYVDGADIIGSTITTGTACANYKQHESTLTITNKKNTTATLSFDYTVTVGGGNIIVGEESVTANGSFSKDLDSNGTATVFIQSNKESKETATTITISNIKLIAHVNATVTFQPAKNGSYTVNGNQITEPYENTQGSTTPYKVNATPAGGYQFMGWYDVTNGKYISTAAATELNIESDCTITARFASETAALFETGGWQFDDLDEAGTYAQANNQNKITLIKSGSLLAGDYTIPAGVTLLIPFDEANTLYGETPTTTRTISETKPFRTLTMASGSSITLASGAAISVGGQYFASQGGQSGKMVGPYGYIKMESGSAITVQNGASLYAWGFISGNGAVTVESGGSVYEWYQILDFRGGTATAHIVTFGNYKVFPLSQYTVQNVEVPLTLHAGASETVYTAVLADGKIYPTPIQFIGNDGMFKLISGSLTKTYDGSTDRLIYTINGEAEVNSLTLSLANVELNSSKFVLPFTSNMTVVLKSDSKLTMNQTAALLPSVSVTIEKDAELVVPNGRSMYIYDVDQWGNYCFGSNVYVKSVSVPYAPGKTGKPASLTDAKVDVNGKLTAIGSVYTTESGANICSSEGGGRFVQQNAPGQEKTTYQVKKQASLKSFTTEYYDIPITPAQLKNAAGVNPSYTQTKDAKAGDTFTYCKCQECGGGTWVKNLKVAEFSATKYGTLKEAADAAKGASYVRLLHSTTEDITAQYDLYLDLHGYTVTGDFDMGDKLLSGMDSSVSKDYVTAPSGKIVGKVTGTVAPTYQTPTEETAEGKTYDRYVAIQGTEADGNTPNLSFHHFNISVTGYRFELTTGGTPQCALFFIGKFQGDDAAKKYLSKLGFTLKGENDKPLGEADYEFSADTVIPEMPADGVPSESEVVRSGDAFLFEVYLMRSFKKDEPNGYTEKISATAQATFKNGKTQNSEPKQWSFKDAWTKTDGLKDLTSEQQEILNKFLTELGITKQAE